MRCRTCDYTLFDIRERTCPECGSPFKPSDFDFHQSAVRFCCPHCKQDYYGMDERGHLVPREFDCVKCKQHVTMDEMVMQPTEGVLETQTQQAILPWNDFNRRSAFKRFFITLGWGMGRPGDLGRSLRGKPRVWRALIFAVVLAILTSFWVAPWVVMGFAGRSMNSILRDVATGIVIYLAVTTGIALALIFVWALFAHAILRIAKGPARTIGATIECVAYCSAPMALLIIPCLGIYAVPIALVWWAVSLTLALKAAHECTRTRAGIAAWGVPLALLTTIAALIISFVAPLFMSGSRFTPPPPTMPTTGTPAPTVNTGPAAPSPAIPGDGVTDPAPETTPAEPPAPSTPEPQDKPHVPDIPQP